MLLVLVSSIRGFSTKKLSSLSGFRFFINHQASDPVSAILDFEENPTLFRSLCNEVKNMILEKAINIELPGLIMTFCYSRPDSDENLSITMDLLKRKNVDMYFSRLYCDHNELLRRVEDPARKSSSVRKLSKASDLEEAMKRHGFEEKIPYVESLSIDTTTITARTTAEAIAKHYGFHPYSTTKRTLVSLSESVLQE